MPITNIKIGARPNVITLTNTAIDKIAQLLSEEANQDLALRVAVRPGGCSGFSYDMYFDSEIDENDIVRTFDNVRVIVDSESSSLIKGAILDWKDGLNAGFNITNPNATRTCGCGSSFS